MKHDSWIYLKDGSPYEAILHLFPKGIPVRDPFPMATGERDGKTYALWNVDPERLEAEQEMHLAITIANHCNVATEYVINEAYRTGGYGLSHEWVDKLEVGSEGYFRSKELEEFLSQYNEQDYYAWSEFIETHRKKWIESETSESKT